MDIKALEHKLKKYQNNIEKDFSTTLNEMINDLDPTILANEYSKKFAKRIKSDPFYYLKFEESGRKKALYKFNEALKDIPKSNGSRYFNKIDLNIGIISDEFLYESFKDVADIEYISREDTRIKEYDLVIFATTWRGVDNSWEGAAHPNNEKRDEMIDLAEKYNQLNIPTVFYSKEDPVNYHLFKSLAEHCKYIFTTALEVVEKYREDTGNDHVSVLQFGVNPYIHNPVGSRTKYADEFKNEILFAGSWLSKYPVRMNETQKLFDAIKKEKAPFTIIDRNLNLQNPRYQFPSKYIENLAPPVPHTKLMNMHKVLRWSINMNSVKYSQTMFANRVYELQAFGNILLSNYNTGINNIFPNVRMINNSEDFSRIYATREEDLRDLQAKGIRNAFKEHTTYHRVKQIASTVGFSVEEEKGKILVIFDEENETNRKSFEQQIYNDKTAVPQEKLNEVTLEDYDYVTYFSSDYVYEEYYLDDMISAFKYTDVDFVTKDQNLEAHNYIAKLYNKYASMIHIPSITSLDRLQELEYGYNLDQVELVKKEDAAVTTPSNTTKEFSVIVPIHNNGTYLEEKCFASLKRSSSFDKMEIIFVNDGSTDDTTIKIINRLRRRYPDIVYKENDSGSGSASKPRNQGARIATTDYITYLDPDNEAIGDGYHHLFEKLKENDVDMVVGNIIKEDSNRKNAGRYTDILKRSNDNAMLVEDPKDFLIRSDLRVQSIQALIVKKSVIVDNDLIMVEGAAGQDTMFYQELVLNCSSLLGINKYIHIYYAAVAGSVTNTISEKFFEKYYKLEQQRIPYLKRYGLMDVYLDLRYNSYVQQWYLTRLDRVAPENRHAAVTKFLDIINLYEEYHPKYEDKLKQQLDKLSKEVAYSKKI